MESTIKILELPDGRLDTRNAALYLGLSTGTLALMRCKGDGPPFVKRGRVFYFREELDSWLAAGKQISTSQRVVTTIC